ncbi:MAG: DNA repair protein RecN, partial [Candidatus Dadabacteria bacterium]|nr:DNA repair protein RecN [Candidatus Dadabacteria bacterium]
VGQKIRKLSQSYQVICITHLPQVAKFADSHLAVSKTHNDNKTQVTIKSLEGDERVFELARMIGGFNITQKTIDAAYEMLKH